MCILQRIMIKPLEELEMINDYVSQPLYMEKWTR